MVILDTNIIIDHLRRSGARESVLEKLAKEPHQEALSISIISVQELYEGQSTLKEEKEKDLFATLSPLDLLSYTFEVARLAGEIARDRKTGIDLADAAIAATTIINNGQLLTLNKKDFQGIKDLEFFVFDK